MSTEHRWRFPGWRSVRTRVTVVASLVIAAFVTAGIVLQFVLQINAVRGTVDQQLRTYVTQIAQAAPTGNWPRPLPAAPLDPAAQAQVIGPDGTVRAGTRGLTGVAATYALPPGSTTPIRLKGADGVIPEDVRVVADRFTVHGEAVVIIATTPTGLLRDINSEFTHRLILGFPITLVLAALAVWIMVGRALGPVERIRNAASAITSADLSRRVPEPGTDDEIGHLAQTMNQMLTRLEDSARRQRTFVADASHELRSPVAAIRTTLDVALAHPDSAPWPIIAARAAQQGERLEQLLQQLLLLAKADEHTLAGNRRRVDIGELLREVSRTTRSDRASADQASTDRNTAGTDRTNAADQAHADRTATSQANIDPAGDELVAAAGPANVKRGKVDRVGVELALAGDAVVLGNPGNLGRLFRNLLDNAVRYAASTVMITTEVTATTVEIHIVDDGPGIPPADRERVFDRFVRLDSSRDRTTGNSGLGLAIAREIATSHDGSIEFEDGPGAKDRPGAHVVVRLPRHHD